MAKWQKTRLDKQLDHYLDNHPVERAVFDQVADYHTRGLALLRDHVDLPALTGQLLLPDADAVELLFRYLRHGSSRLVAMGIVESDADHRSRPWRVRVMLFDEHDDLQADEGGEHGEAFEPASDGPILYGLAAVASHIAILCMNYHGECPEELKPQYLIKKIPSLRPTLSRTAGRVTWRVNYLANGHTWLMRCEIRKAEAVIC